MRNLLAAFAVFTLGSLTACGGDPGDPGASDSAAPVASPSDPTSGTARSGQPTLGSYPRLDADDYTFVLDTICYCPLFGPTAITVEDGEVTSAVLTRGSRGMRKGGQAPESRRLTINDIIDEANDQDPDHVHVAWPDGQDWPNRVQIDQLPRAVDDEITYVIKKVRIS